MHECLANTRTSSTEGSIILHWVWLLQFFLVVLALALALVVLALVLKKFMIPVLVFVCVFDLLFSPL